MDHKKDREVKNWCLQIVVLEKSLKSPLDSKEIKPVNLKINQPWIFIWRTDAEAPILWSLDVKIQLTGKDLDSGKDWRQKEKRATANEMVTQHHWLDEHEFEQTPGDNEKEGSLVVAVCKVAKSQTRLSHWTTTTIIHTWSIKFFYLC